MKKRNQISREQENKNKIKLFDFIFEEYGDDIGGGSSDFSAYGSIGGGGVDIFKKTFVDPFIDIFRSGQYAAEKITGSIFYFAKKLLVNFPRLFSPSKPLIFNEIRDQEKAAFLRMNKRYAEVLKKNAEALQNKDFKLMVFLLNPKAILGAKLIQESPKAAFNILNTFSGNKLQDLASDIKSAYNSLPDVQRRNLRVQKYVEKYQKDDEKNKKISQKSTVPDGASYMSYGADYHYSSGMDYDSYINEEQNQNTPTERDFLEAALIYLNKNPQIKQEMFGKVIEELKPVGNELFKNLMQKFEAIKKASSLEEYSKLTGANLSAAKQEMDKIINSELQKQKDIDTQKAKQAYLKIKSIIEPQLLETLKKDYFSNLNQILKPVLGSLTSEQQNKIKELFTK
jgi:hypothetical protein